MIDLQSNPEGDAYKKLIDFASKRAPFFMLSDRESLLRNEHCLSVFGQLEPFLVSVHSCNELRGRNEIAYSDGYYCMYKCCEEASAILKEAADSLFSWEHPHLPEDLCFLNDDGTDFLVSIAHEGIWYIRAEKDDTSTSLPKEVFGRDLDR